MPGTQFRYLILIAVMGVGLLGLVATSGPDAGRPPRWPAAQTLLNVEGWAVNGPNVEHVNGVTHASFTYMNEADAHFIATLTVSTNTNPKGIYRAGADVPFLGSGYTVLAAPSALGPAPPGGGAQLLQRGSETWLQLYTYGERRGRLGNGLIAWGAWGLDVLDGTRGDYYLARVVMRLDGTDSPAAKSVVELANELFPRIADWYAST